MNLIQMYIGYIGASRAYGLHFEVMDLALFLTNEGITIYFGHRYRWARKWRINVTDGRVTQGAVRKAVPAASRLPAKVAAAASGAFATAAQALASPAAVAPSTYTPVVSVVPYTREPAAAAKDSASRIPQHDALRAPQVSRRKQEAAAEVV